jgi:hypothetical protein
VQRLAFGVLVGLWSLGDGVQKRPASLHARKRRGKGGRSRGAGPRGHDGLHAEGRAGDGGGLSLFFGSLGLPLWAFAV